MKRADERAIYAARGFFGVGFIALGAIALWRVASAPAPPQSKAIGAALGVAMIALGIARLVQFARYRRRSQR